MKCIPLRARDGSIRAYSVVDDDDFDWLNQRRWSLNSGGYAVMTDRENGVSHTVYMHRLITGAPRGVEVDHEHGNRLDNRRAELRLVTPAQNHQNRRLNCNNKSGEPGVRWDSAMRRWALTFHLSFSDKAEAVRVSREIRAQYMPFAPNQEVTSAAV